MMQSLTEKRFDIVKLKRHAHNIRLLMVLAEIIMENKTLRFSQILSTYGFINNKEEYDVEPEEILDRVYDTKRDVEKRKSNGKQQ